MHTGSWSEIPQKFVPRFYQKLIKKFLLNVNQDVDFLLIPLRIPQQFSQEMLFVISPEVSLGDPSVYQKFYQLCFFWDWWSQTSIQDYFIMVPLWIDLQILSQRYFPKFFEVFFQKYIVEFLQGFYFKYSSIASNALLQQILRIFLLKFLKEFLQNVLFKIPPGFQYSPGTPQK